jgi:hypothetical protein
MKLASRTQANVIVDHLFIGLIICLIYIFRVDLDMSEGVEELK